MIPVEECNSVTVIAYPVNKQRKNDRRRTVYGYGMIRANSWMNGRTYMLSQRRFESHCQVYLSE